MTAGEQTLRRPPRYRPSWGGACLCGSGRRYHACCRDNLPGFERGRAFTGAWAIADWKGGLTAIRADVTQYTIWHRSHTAPPGRVLPDALRFGSLFIVDIAALSELVADLVQTYFQLGRQAELDRVLGRLAGNIDDPRWARKILYHRGIVALGMDRRTVAQARVRELGPITASEADLDVLQLSLDVNSDELGFSERRALLDRVLELTSSPADKIQYSGAKAFGLLMVDDRQGAKAELTKIRAAINEMNAERPLTGRSAVYACLVLQHLAVLDHDDAGLLEVTAWYDRLLGEPGWPAEGVAHLMKLKGDVLRYGGRFDAAVEAYDHALSAGPDPVASVFRAECLMRAGRVTVAKDAILSIETVGMDRHGAADHAFILAIIALSLPSPAFLERAQMALASVKTPEPYFDTQRLNLLVAVQNARTLAAEAPEPVDVGPLLSILDSLSRYVQLQPNVAGVGLNLNNMIDDYIARERRQLETARRKSSG